MPHLHFKTNLHIPIKSHSALFAKSLVLSALYAKCHIVLCSAYDSMQSVLTAWYYAVLYDSMQSVLSTWYYAVRFDSMQSVRVLPRHLSRPRDAPVGSNSAGCGAPSTTCAPALRSPAAPDHERAHSLIIIQR